MHFHVISLFPEMIEAAASAGVVGQAIARGKLGLTSISPRDFTSNTHHTVDDRPFGGGMAAVGGITLEGCAVEGSNAPLLRCKLAAQDRCCLGTHEAVAGPQQFLGRIKGKGRYRRGRVVRSWRRQLHECKLHVY